MRSLGRPISAALLFLLFSSSAGATGQSLFLAIVVNGRETGQVGEFIQRDGEILARPQELHELGFVLPREMLRGSDPIPLAGLAGLQARVNTQRQTLVVTADSAVLRPMDLAAGSHTRLGPLSAAGWGAVLNYDLLGTFTGTKTLGGAFLDARVFGFYGTLSTSALGSFSAGPAQQAPVTRLETAYTYAEPDEMRRWRAGDLVSGALSWSRAVRLGGAQVSSDFALRPDLVSYPLPLVSASAAVPSTVDVMVNGIRALSQPVQPGPFQMRSLPIVTGAGDVLITATDALGRQTVVALPFYASATLLRPGLASYSLEAGAVRRRFGLADSDYAGWAASGTLRYGWTERLTLETHAEATAGLLFGGAGGALQIGTLGILTASLAGSSGGGADGPGSTRGSGYLASVGIERRSPRLNLFASGTFASPGYRDIAAINGAPVPRRTLRVGLGLPLGRYGSLNFAYVDQRAGRGAFRSDSFSALGSGVVAGGDVSLVNVTHAARIAGNINLYVTGFKDLLREGTFGATIGVSMSFGGGISAGTSVGLDSGHPGVRTQVQRAALVPGDVGFRLHDQEGRFAHRVAEADYVSNWGRITGGVDQTPNGAAGRAGLRGALVAGGGGVFVANNINDSFAVVRSGDVPNVRVLYENRPVGRTDSGGRLLVPYLNSFQNNRLALEPADLPTDVEVDRMRALVRPGDRVGIVVDFGVRSSNAALLRLQDAHGAPLPLGSRLRLHGSQPVPVGYEGEAFVTGLRANNQAEVELPNGSRCRVQFEYRPMRGDVPVVGALPCR
jgi:outer membrane usher protein